MLQPVGTARGITESMPTGDKTTRDFETDAAGDSAATGSGEMWGDLFLARLTPETKSGLSPAQLEDIKRVAAAVAPSRHRVDWRFSLPAPLGGKRFYGVLLAGADRRGAAAPCPGPDDAPAVSPPPGPLERPGPGGRIRAGGAGADAAGGDRPCR